MEKLGTSPSFGLVLATVASFSCSSLLTRIQSFWRELALRLGIFILLFFLKLSSQQWIKICLKHFTYWLAGWQRNWQDKDSTMMCVLICSCFLTRKLWSLKLHDVKIFIAFSRREIRCQIGRAHV